MKKRNKIVALLLTGMLTLSMLAGCGSSTGDSAQAGTDAPAPAEEESGDAAPAEQESKPAEEAAADGEKIKMTMMVWGNIDDYTPSNEVLLKTFPELAEKIDLQVELGGSGDADVAEKFRLMLASGEELPDLIRLNYTQFPEFADAGVLYDLADAVAPYEGDIIDAAKSLMTWNGAYYAVPHRFEFPRAHIDKTR